MKRTLSTVLFVAIVLTLFTPLQVRAASGTCGDGLTWQLSSDGTMRISGTGPMVNVTATAQVPWTNYRHLIQKVIVAEGVTSIGDCAFSACHNLRSISLPESLAYIGYTAFSGAPITEFRIPEAVTYIGRHAFWGCAMTTLCLPDKVSVIEQNTFDGCDNLSTIILPAGLTKIGWRAFDNCPKLKTFHFKGTQAQWENISIDSTNTYLLSAAKHYNVGLLDNCINSGHYCHQCRKFLTQTRPENGQHHFIDSICTDCGSLDGSELVLKKDMSVNIQLDRDLYLDLAGHKLSGTVKTNGYSVYGMDSATNDFTDSKAGTFSCKAANGDPLAPQRLYTTTDGDHYLAISHNGSYSFHRFQVAITEEAVSPEVKGLRFKAVFYGDAQVLSQLDATHALNFRVQLSNNEPVFVPYKQKQIQSGQEISLQIRNYDVENYGETTLTTLVRVKLADGLTVNSKAVRRSFRQIAEAMDPSAYTATERSALQTMLSAYAIVKAWNIPILTNG